MKSETTASTEIPQPGDRDPGLSRRNELAAHSAATRLAVELERDGHLPDRAIGADREDRRRAVREVVAGRHVEPRRAPCAGRAARRRARARARPARGRSRRTRAGRSRRRGRRGSTPRAGRATPAGSGRPASRRRRARSSARTGAASATDPTTGKPSSVFARARRVEDRDDVLGAVANDTACGLAEVRVARPSLGEDQQPTRARHRAPAAFGGSCTPSTNSTPGHGSDASSRLPSRST